MNSAYRFIVPAVLLTCLAAGSLGRCDESAEQPYVYKNWEHFTVKDGLRSNWVWSLLEDRHGHLWFGTHRGGVGRYDGQRFASFTTEDGLANNIVRCLCEDRRGRIWLATEGGGVSCYDGQRFTTFTTEGSFRDSQFMRGVAQVPISHPFPRTSSMAAER